MIQQTHPPHLVLIGLGYSARTIARYASSQGISTVGTARADNRCGQLRAAGFQVELFDGETVSNQLSGHLKRATHVLSSASPVLDGVDDPVLSAIRPHLSADALEWLGYLSTIGVYGGRDGEWVDERSATAPTSRRARRRVEAETAWMSLGEMLNRPVAVFRLAGIYGPGRSPLEKLLRGRSRRIIKPGQVFNRIHVDDIAEVVVRSAVERSSGVYNVADDEPAPPQDVIVHAAELLGVEPPDAVPFDEADLSPMARSFYSDNKRVCNARIKNELGVVLKYPSFREGLRALVKDVAPVTEASQVGPYALDRRFR